MSRILTAAATTPKRAIPAALRQQVWRHYIGEKYSGPCVTRWCKNVITVFNFECGHNIAESRGGATTLDNLRPICSVCNKSMSNNYTIDQWQDLGSATTTSPWSCFKFS